MILALLSIPVLIAPLLVVSPFGPRCVIPPYICLVLFSVLFVDGVLESLEIEEKIERIAHLVLSVVTSCVVAAIIVYYICIQAVHYRYHKLRLEYIERQVERGYTTVVVPNFCHQELIQCGSMKRKYWQGAYRRYYNIDPNLRFVVVEMDEFDEWVEEFEKGGN